MDLDLDLDLLYMTMKMVELDRRGGLGGTLTWRTWKGLVCVERTQTGRGYGEEGKSM